ncbi:MAG: DUF1311 domain-containing protein [Azonexus sp.]|nr:DUF1311 domain-containing protein [Betaproteobacteria bacterium]MBK8917849.1 DUF1311 domain-containing protein [Betaproteobacteria bacterium]MBP6035936.1 DUF1311 domain-containing protein [Azonexus sp.]MBP6906246.1 DUF1311 domain-containing protein [Azonexus sp.]
MRTHHATLVAISLTLFGTTTVWADDTHINRDCDNGAPMLEVNHCASFKFAEADAEMNELYKEKLASAKSPASKKRFRDAQRAWLTFRDKVCLYEAGLDNESGSIWPFHQFGCMEFYTKRRIDDFKVYLKCTTDDCP